MFSQHSNIIILTGILSIEQNISSSSKLSSLLSSSSPSEPLFVELVRLVFDDLDEHVSELFVVFIPVFVFVFVAVFVVVTTFLFAKISRFS